MLAYGGAGPRRAGSRSRNGRRHRCRDAGSVRQRDADADGDHARADRAAAGAHAWLTFCGSASSVDVRARGERGVQTDFAVRGAHFGQMLMLVDGVRLNDAQSGHHNGDVPVPLDAIERIEILHGGGSSLFGADAFGGTINVITRRDASAGVGHSRRPAASALVAGRGHVDASGRGGCPRSDRRVGRSFGRASCSSAATRPPGSARERRLARARASSCPYLWKDFGANGFYGNAPSHEWTNQTLVAADHRFGLACRLAADRRRVVPDPRRPLPLRRDGGQASPRTATAPTPCSGRSKASRRVRDEQRRDRRRRGRRRLDPLEQPWRSHERPGQRVRRVAACGSSARTQLEASLRVDRYSEFGTAWSPGAGIGWWPSPRVRLRASAARAFRVPTFTERYYQDPANWARPDVHAETAWAGDAGADLFLAEGLTASATLFGRLEHDVIDWLRPTTVGPLAHLQHPRRGHVRRRADGQEDAARGRVRAGGLHRPSTCARRR